MGLYSLRSLAFTSLIGQQWPTPTRAKFQGTSYKILGNFLKYCVLSPKYCVFILEYYVLYTNSLSKKILGTLAIKLDTSKKIVHSSRKNTLGFQKNCEIISKGELVVYCK